MHRIKFLSIVALSSSAFLLSSCGSKTALDYEKLNNLLLLEQGPVMASKVAQLECKHVQEDDNKATYNCTSSLMRNSIYYGQQDLLHKDVHEGDHDGMYSFEVTIVKSSSDYVVSKLKLIESIK